MKIVDNPRIALIIGLISAIFLIGAISAYKKDDGLSLELSSKLIKPVQIFHSNETAESSLRATDFSLSESLSIKISLVASLFMGLTCLIICFVAAKRKIFGITYSISFLLSSGALVLMYFEFGFLLNV